MNHVPFSWPQLLVIGVGFVTPFLTHLVTTKRFPARWRKGAAYAISALAAVIIQVSYNAGETWKAYLAAIFYAWAAMVIGHFTGIPDATNNATPNFGIGPKTYEVHAGVKVTESDGPPPPPRSPGMAEQPRQSRMKPPKG